MTTGYLAITLHALPTTISSQFLLAHLFPICVCVCLCGFVCVLHLWQSSQTFVPNLLAASQNVFHCARAANDSRVGCTVQHPYLAFLACLSTHTENVQISNIEKGNICLRQS